jgi:hypothetical protein
MLVACKKYLAINYLLWSYMQQLEQDRLMFLKDSNYTAHTYGANEGVNCGVLFLGRGTQAKNKESDISGMVRWGGFIKRRPEWRRHTCDLFRR